LVCVSSRNYPDDIWRVISQCVGWQCEWQLRTQPRSWPLTHEKPHNLRLSFLSQPPVIIDHHSPSPAPPFRSNSKINKTTSSSSMVRRSSRVFSQYSLYNNKTVLTVSTEADRCSSPLTNIINNDTNTTTAMSTAVGAVAKRHREENSDEATPDIKKLKSGGKKAGLYCRLPR
jgi:hypothetical protein